MAFHKDVTGVNNHEPKGVEDAADGAIYIADGAGSGVWTVPEVITGEFTVQIARFDANGTWTKPADTFLVRVYAVGGGQGSGPGSDGTSTTFGSHLTATGGNVAVGSSGDLNIVTGTGTKPTFVGPYMLINGGIDSTTTVLADFLASGKNGNWATETYLASSLASTVAITIGTGGAGSSPNPVAGGSGHVVVESYIPS